MTLLERVEAMLLNDAIHPTHEHNDLTTYISTGAVGCKLRISELDGMLWAGTQFRAKGVPHAPSQRRYCPLHIVVRLRLLSTANGHHIPAHHNLSRERGKHD